MKETKTNQNSNETYNIFIQKVPLLYDDYFPEKEIKVIKKDLKSPRITTGIKKSSKRKQRLYEKFLKKENSLNESEKNYLSQLNGVQKSYITRT